MRLISFVSRRRIPASLNLIVRCAEMLRRDGVYRSVPVAWEESHGGGHWSGASVEYWRFFSDGRWVRCSSENHALPFYEMSQHHLHAPPGPAVRGQITAGSYEVAGDLLKIREASPFVEAQIGPEWLIYEWKISGERLKPTDVSRYRMELFFETHLTCVGADREE